MFANPLEYPMNSDFIMFQPQQVRDRLITCGFCETQVLLFEVPYCVISGVGAGIIQDYKNKVFYKFLCSTLGVIDGLTDQELRVVADHEKSELRLTLNEAVNAEGKSGLTTREEEARRHLPEVKELENKYGNQVVTSTLTKIGTIASQYPVIPRYIMLFWACDLVVDRFNELHGYATPMAKSMLQASQINNFIEFLNLVWKEYGSRLPHDRFFVIYSNTVKAKKEIKS